MKTEVHFTSGNDDWETPIELFNQLNKEFGFTVDVAADITNAKLPKFFSKKENGLLQSWAGENVFCNPPYSNLYPWLQKAAEEQKNGAVSVFLIPARTDTQAFHEFVWDNILHKTRTKVAVRFLKGRLKFNNCDVPAPFPSMVVIFLP